MDIKKLNESLIELKKTLSEATVAIKSDASTLGKMEKEFEKINLKKISDLIKKFSKEYVASPSAKKIIVQFNNLQSQIDKVEDMVKAEHTKVFDQVGK